MQQQQRKKPKRKTAVIESTWKSNYCNQYLLLAAQRGGERRMLKVTLIKNCSLTKSSVPDASLRLTQGNLGQRLMKTSFRGRCTSPVNSTHVCSGPPRLCVINQPIFLSAFQLRYTTAPWCSIFMSHSIPFHFEGDVTSCFFLQHTSFGRKGVNMISNGVCMVYTEWCRDGSSFTWHQPCNTKSAL